MAIIHIVFNMIGTLLGLVVFYGIGGLLGSFPFLSNSADAAGIALCHSVFNAATTFVLLPFGRQLVALSRIIIPVGEDERQREKIFLDERLLLSPGMAVHESFNMACAMASLAKDTVLDSLSIMQKYDVNKAEAIKEGENELDTYEDKLGSFLVKAAACALNESDSRDVSKLLHSINDFERIGDHALNIKNSADEMKDKALHFSAEAKEELGLLFKALNDVLSLSIDSFVNNDLEKAAHVEPLEQVIDVLIGQIKRRHIERLQAGRCTIELGFILNDLLNNCERISDHCSNIAVCVTEIDRGEFDTHEYLNTVKSGNDTRYKADFARYAKEYELK